MSDRSSERIRRSQLPSDEIPHGTLNGYTNYICRCDACRKAKSEDAQSVRARRRAEGVPAHLSHGKSIRYTEWGCRCDDCKAAHSASRTRRRLAANDAARLSAQASGSRWTGPELEIATRTDLTAREAADLLGRSYLAVEHARARCLHDPRYIALLGQPRLDGDS